MIIYILFLSFLPFTIGNGHKPFKWADAIHSNFSEVLKSDAFVDKSGLIKELYHRGHIFITAPRGFGKTTNLDMLRRFYEVTLNKDHKMLIEDPTKTESYRLFSENNLQVFQDRTFFHEHFGQYPVIRLDLIDLRGNDVNKFLKDFRRRVAKTFSEHEYLVNSTKLNRTELVKLKQVLNTTRYRLLSNKALQNSGLFLSRLLFKHFGRKCIVLMDNFHTLIPGMINWTPKDEEMKKLINCLTRFVHFLLLGNECVKQGIIMGSMRMSGIYIGYHNQIKIVTFPSDLQIYQYFGLTELEVKKILNTFDMSDKFPQVKKWYSGYPVERSDVVLYNTFTIVKLLNQHYMRDYWPNWLQFRNILMNEDIYDLLRNKTENRKVMTFRLTHQVTIEDLKTLRGLCGITWRSRGYVSEEERNLFFQYMLEEGYLKVIGRYSDNYVDARVANDEINQYITNKLYIVSFFIRKTRKYIGLIPSEDDTYWRSPWANQEQE